MPADRPFEREAHGLMEWIAWAMMYRSGGTDVRIAVEVSRDHGVEIPLAVGLNGDRIEVVEVLDQWYGSDYRYCKVKGGDGALYILRLDEGRSEWHLTMFASARAQTSHRREL